jgi:hypothetical protein
MNTLIRKLSEEALQLVADEHTGGDKSRLNKDSYHVKWLIQERFCELIVRECAAKAWWAEHLTDAQNNIKQYFGLDNKCR